MKSFWKNPIWHLAIGIFFLAFAVSILVYLMVYKWESRTELIRDVVRLILISVFGISRLMKWYKLRQAKKNITSEDEVYL